MSRLTGSNMGTQVEVLEHMDDAKGANNRYQNLNCQLTKNGGADLNLRLYRDG